MSIHELIFIGSTNQDLDKEQILLVEECLQKLESLSEEFLSNKEREVTKRVKSMLKANYQDRIDIYNQIFSFGEVYKIIKAYEAFIYGAANKQMSFNCHFNFSGLNYTEELIKEAKRIIFLKNRSDFYLKMSINNCLGILNFPKLLKKALDSLEITSVIAHKVIRDEANIEHLERMIIDNLQGILHNNFNYLKEQLRAQTIEFMYSTEKKAERNCLYIA